RRQNGYTETDMGKTSTPAAHPKTASAPRRARRETPTNGTAIRWIEELSVRDTDTAGGKGANLGELTRFGIPVPPGFVVTAEAFRQFLESSELRQSIRDRLGDLNVDDGRALEQAAEELQQEVRQASIP